MYPKKFQNKTNGVTPRRWIVCANRELAKLYSKECNDLWMLDLRELRKLEPKIKSKKFQKKWRAIKQHNKNRLADWIYQHMGIRINKKSLFDI